MSKIIIQLMGGLVQDVFIKGTGKLESAIVVDEDVEGPDPEDITSVKIKRPGLGNMTYEACIHTEGISRLKKGCDVDLIVNKYLKG